jgi:hypothetical protein
MTTFSQPSDLSYNPVLGLVWMSDATKSSIYGFASSTRDIWIARHGTGAELFSAGVNTESFESTITNPALATYTIDVSAHLSSVQRMIGDTALLYISGSAVSSPNPLLVIIDQATKAIVGVCNADPVYGAPILDQTIDGDNLWVVMGPLDGNSGNIKKFSVSAALAAYPTAVTATVTSATARDYSAVVYDPVTGNIFAGTSGQSGGELLASLDPATLADIATQGFSSSARFANFVSLLAAGGWIWIGGNEQGILRITPNAFPGTVTTVAITGMNAAQRLVEDAPSQTILVGDNGNFTSSNIGRVYIATEPTVASSFATAGTNAQPTALATQLSQVEVVGAIAIAENVIQLQFSMPVYFTGLGDPQDASQPSLYSVMEVDGTFGRDGTATRPVTPAVVTLALAGETLPEGFAAGTCVDITLDRSMTPFPSQYIVECTGIFSADLTRTLDPDDNAFQLYGVFKGLIPASVELPTQTRDIANPQTYLSAASNLPVPNNPAVLGVFTVDDTGDYAFDSGLVAFKKRIYRRLITNPGGFLHLGASYGVGVPSYGKKLATSAVVQSLAGQAEGQIGQEPESQSVKVTIVQDPDEPGLVRFNIFVKTNGGQSAKYTAAFPSGT